MSCYIRCNKMNKYIFFVCNCVKSVGIKINFFENMANYHTHCSSYEFVLFSYFHWKTKQLRPIK